MYGFLPIDNNAKLFFRLTHPIIHFRSAFHALHNDRHLACNPLQSINVTASHLDRYSASPHGRHIHAGGIYRNLRLKPGCLFFDDSGNLLIIHGFVFSGYHINGSPIVASAASTQHGHSRGAGHCAYILHIVYGQNRFHHLISHLGCLLQIRIGTQLYIYGKLRGVHVRHKRRSVAEGQQNAHYQQHSHQNQQNRLYFQRDSQKLLVPPHQTSEYPALLLFLCLCQDLGGHGRHYCQRNHQTGNQGVGNGQSHIHKQLPGDPLRKHNRQKHTNGGERRCRYGTGHFPGPFHSRLLHGPSFTSQPINIFDYDNRIIHQHADSQRKTRQGNYIQRHTAEIHAHNSRHQTDGNGEGHHNGRSQILQKQY